MSQAQELVLGGAYLGTLTTGTNASSAAIDTAGYDIAIVGCYVNAVTATGALTVKVQECATSGGSYTDVTGAAFQVFVTADNGALKTGTLQIANRLRYLKVYHATATAGATVGTMVLLGLKKSPIGGVATGCPYFQV